MNGKCVELSVWFLEKSLLPSLRLFFINILNIFFIRIVSHMQATCFSRAGHTLSQNIGRDACRILFLLKILIGNFFFQDLGIFMKITITIGNINCCFGTIFFLSYFPNFLNIKYFILFLF